MEKQQSKQANLSLILFTLLFPSKNHLLKKFMNKKQEWRETNSGHIAPLL